MTDHQEDSSLNGDGKEKERQLLQSCSTGREDVVKSLLSQGVAVHARDKGGRTGLILAATHGYENIVRLVLDHDTPDVVNTKDRRGRNALSWACEKGHYRIVEMLIGRGADAAVKEFDWTTPLTRACLNGHDEIVRLLVKSGADADTRHRDGSTPLMLACAKGYHKVVDALIELGADVDVDNGATALTEGCANGHFKVVESLIRIGGADVNSISGLYERTALVEACTNGHENVVRLLLECGASVNRCGDTDGITPLLAACKRGGGDEMMVRLLVHHGADVNWKTVNGETPLMEASSHGYDKVVECLIEHVEDVNVKNSYECSALMMACISGHGQIADRLLEHGADLNISGRYGTALIGACMKGYRKIVEKLVQLGADVNASDWKGMTPLMWAITSGHVPIVKLLIELGVDIHHAGKYKAPLVMACGMGNESILGLLVGAAGTGVNDVFGDEDKRSALLEACRNGRVKVVEILLLKLDVNVGDCSSALIVACANGHENVVGVLVDHCGDALMKSVNAATALIKASQNGHVKVLTYLISRGFDMNATDTDDRTALMGACMNGEEKTAQLLIEHGSDVNLLDADGMTALMWACTAEDVVVGNLKLKSLGQFRTLNGKWCIESQSKRVLELLLKHGASTDTQQKEQGWSPVMMVVMADRVECLRTLLSSTPNLDLTDAQNWTVFSHAMANASAQCLRLLLDSGQLLMTDGGLLKPVHRIADVSTVSLNPLTLTLKFGVFEWEWCPLEYFFPMSLSALESGFCPGEVQYDVSLNLSPLVLSLVQSVDRLVSIFFQRLYFFPEDYTTLSSNQKIRQRISNVDFLNEITRNPISLQAWSFLTVSKRISMSGHPCLRKQRVNSLPIPDKLKRRLNFQKDSY